MKIFEYVNEHHNPEHIAVSLTFCSDPPIAVKPVLERDALNRIAYARLFLARRRGPEVTILAGTAQDRAHKRAMVSSPCGTPVIAPMTA
jgi:hypothetical protein